MIKLYRSRRDSKVFGLCGGLAETLNVDPTLLRLVVAVTTVFSAGTVIPVYIIASLVIPKEPSLEPSFAGAPQGYGHHSHHSHKCGWNGHARQEPAPAAAAASTVDPLDEMMKDIEQKALRREIEELRAKLAKIEQQQMQQSQASQSAANIQSDNHTKGDA